MKRSKATDAIPLFWPWRLWTVLDWLAHPVDPCYLQIWSRVTTANIRSGLEPILMLASAVRPWVRTIYNLHAYVYIYIYDWIAKEHCECRRVWEKICIVSFVQSANRLCGFAQIIKLRVHTTPLPMHDVFGPSKLAASKSHICKKLLISVFEKLDKQLSLLPCPNQLELLFPTSGICLC